MARVFDSPMAAVDGQDFLGVGVVWCQAGYAAGGFARYFACFFVRDVPFDDEGMAYVWEVKVRVEFGCGPDFTDLDASMVRRGTVGEIGFFAVLEVQLDILKDSTLVAFYGEEVMGVAFFDDVLGELALGEEGISGDGFTFDIDGVEKRDRRLDFIYAFDLIRTFYGQGADFFWVYGILVLWPTTLMMWVCRPSSSIALHMVLPSMARVLSCWP